MKNTPEPPTAYTKKHLADALTWVERNVPNGIVLVARALSSTGDDPPRESLEATAAVIECQSCGNTGGAVVSYRQGGGVMSRWECPHCMQNAAPATPVAQRRPARETKLLEMGQACLDWAADTGECHFCPFRGIEPGARPHDEDCPIREHDEAARRGTPS